MTEWRVPLSDLAFGDEELAAVQRVLQRGWISTGPETGAFEQEFASKVGTSYAIAVSSGTAALHLALLAAGVGPGDEVIQPALNFVSAANMTLAVGAAPVFADIEDLDRPVVAVDEVLKAMTDQTKAIIVMYYGGTAAGAAELRAVADARNVALIEDACHAVGADYGPGPLEGQSVGSAGTLSCFSFFSNKNMATAEGGMVATKDPTLADQVRRARSHGMTTLSWDRFSGHASSYDVLGTGFNYRLDDLRSALGRAQLAKLEANNARRRVLRDAYLAAIAADGHWRSPFSTATGRMTSAHLMVALAPTTGARDAARQRLHEAGIQTSFHYPTITDFGAFRGSRRGSLARTAEFSRRAITLPLFPGLSGVDLKEIVDLLLLGSMAR
jgi:dTDP-4-amino-4,6-dideoxygalactose transaminase